MKLRTATPASNPIFAMRTGVFVATFLIAISVPVQLFVTSQTKAISCSTNADCEAQINALRNKSNAYEQEAAALSKKSDSLSVAVSKLSNEISSIQTKIDISQAEFDQLSGEIKTIEERIAENRRTSGELIVRSSLSEDIPLIVRLASSDNIADYIDGEASRMEVRDAIVQKTKENEVLKKELTTKKQKVADVLADQTSQRNALASKKAEQQQLLAETKGSEAAYRSLVSKSNNQIKELQAQQVKINAPVLGNYSPGSGPACGGGYPGKWCNIPMDSVSDDWGMYNRECVSYAAFKVAISGRHMPYWGGIGNANQWDDNARSAGISVNGTPKAGAIGQTDAGPYGHVFYVESVNSDGTINISQYNAAMDGRYSTATINPSGYNFIHF